MLGTDLAEGDRFRKAVQKCRDDLQRLELSREFLGRCRARGVDLDYAKDLWVQMAKFNAYSFCRAHAASYAVLAYSGAYLKRHYPLEFWASALNNNQSLYHPRVSGLGPAGARRILEARERRPFEGLSDFLLRTRLGEEETRSLVLCGGFDWTGRTRPTLMMELNIFRAIRPGYRDAGEMLVTWTPVIPNVADDYEESRKYADERRILGVSVRQHALALFRPLLAREVDADSRGLADRVGRRVRIAGLLEAQRAAETRKGGTMLFLTMEDEFGLFEVTVFPDAVRRIRSLARYGPYVVAGRVEEQYGAVTVSAEDVRLGAGDAGRAT
jgi:DNA polymerase III alpha subunit